MQIPYHQGSVLACVSGRQGLRPSFPVQAQTQQITAENQKIIILPAITDKNREIAKFVVSMDELDFSRNGIKHRNIRDILLAPKWD